VAVSAAWRQHDVSGGGSAVAGGDGTAVTQQSNKSINDNGDGNSDNDSDNKQ
jgi:hypothetical protein